MEDESDCGENILLDEKELSKWKKKDLVQWLVQHKKKKSGSKQVLINRILRSMQFDDSSESESESNSDEDGLGVNDILGIDNLKTEWEAMSTNLCPPTRKEDVENYFIYNKNPLTGRTQGCHRQLRKARKFSNERYVFEVEYNGMGDSLYCYVKAKCKPSMRDTVIVDDGKMARNYSLHVVLVKKTGKIEGGHCNCKPGLSGLCSHIGGLLLTVVDIKSACTSRGCDWLRPQSGLQLQPERLKDLKLSANSEAPVKPYPDTYEAGPCKDPHAFLQDIMAGLGKTQPNSVLYSTLNPAITDISSVIDKYEPPFRFVDTLNLNSTVCQSEFRTFAMSISLEAEEIKKVRESTRGQSSNPVWKEVRANLLTASNFGAVCKKRPETEPSNLISRLRGYKGEIDTKALSYGRKKESQARRDYARSHLKKCGKVTVETTGLVMSSEYPFLGASVDGVVKCEECGVGAIEIKCPYVGRNVTPQEWSRMKTSCVEENENGELKLKPTHNYMFQVMGQMKVLNVQWCDFVVWTKKGLIVERIHFSPEFWRENMMFQLKFFYNSFFLAERFTDRVKRGKKLFS